MSKEEKYKNSDINWIGNIPKHWQIVPFKRIAKRIEVGIAEAATHAYRNNGVPILRTTNIKDGELKGEILFIDEAFANRNKSKTIYENDIVTARTGNAGSSAVLPKKLAGCQCFTMLITTLKEGYDPHYFNYLLNSEYGNAFFRINEWGTAQKNISVAILQELPVPKIAIAEQNEIVNFLNDKCYQLNYCLVNKRKLIGLLKEEKSALINHALTQGIIETALKKPSGSNLLGDIPAHWQVKKLKHICLINPTTSNELDKRSDEQVVFLPMEKVSENGAINCELKKPISVLSSGFTYFEKGDIIIAKITPCFENGKGALLTSLETNFGFGSTEFHVIRPTPKALPDFIYYLTKTNIFMAVGEASMTGAAGQKRIPTSFLESFIIGLPSIEEQRSIIKHIKAEFKKIDIAINKIEREVELLTEYKTSLIYEAVTGKVKVEPWVKEPLEVA